jgi:hypothetical protein
MTQKQPDYKGFIEQLDKFSIEVTKSKDGIYTACSFVEPLFCYDANDLDKLKLDIAGTLISYGRHFFNIPDPDISTRETESKEAGIDIERTSTSTTLVPVFNKAA